MRANKGINLYDLSKSDSIEESKEKIQVNIINNNNYGTFNGSFTGDVNGGIVQNLPETEKKKKKGFWESYELVFKVIGAIAGSIGAIFAIIKLFTDKGK